jgi:hypothetical protein
MMPKRLRRNQPKSNKTRNALIAAGVVGAGAAAEGVRRYRHRRQPESQIES